MGITIGSNIMSLRAQRQLGQTSDRLSSTFERLSSGQRINRASDDAAGLAIASSLDSDRRVFNQGIRNLNDGISALAIAEGALDSLSSIVIRLQELAEQAANGVYGTTQRKSLDQEAQALSDEYFRISKTTKFNGINLLDGTSDGIRLQAGYGLNGGVASNVGGAVGTGNFEARIAFTTGLRPWSATLGDLNGDGVLDLVTADNMGDTASVMIGNGDGSFLAHSSFTTGDAPRAVVVGDLNGDGALDLVTADWSSNTASIRIGNGNGSFLARSSFATGAAPRSIDLGDLNGDGVLDLVTADASSNGASVLLGNGDGSFLARSFFAAGNGPDSIILGDLNGDGVLDLVTADSLSNTASVMIGNGKGSFAARSAFATGSNPWSVTLGDLNGDEVLDLVTADFSGDTASIMLGNGDGTFFARTSFTTGDGPASVVLGDLNGDGALDLVSADWNSGTSSVMLGNGNGSFAARSFLTTGARPGAVLLGDLNGNGVLDLITADRDSNAASVFLANTKSGTAPLLPFSLTTMADARQALPVFQQKLEQLASQRGQIGAFQSRLSVAVNVLSNTSENYAAASGRIMDADIAHESADLVTRQILQQAGSAVLAQANQAPALALRLLT